MARLAILGATGQVGEAVLELLSERGFASSDLLVMGSSQSVGKRLEYGKGYLKAVDPATADFSQVDLALLALPPVAAAEWGRKLADLGVLVLDLSGVWLVDPAIPMAVAGINDDQLADCRARNLVAVADGVTCAVARLLAAIRDLMVPVSLDLTVLHPASRFGRKGVEELASQTARLLSSQSPENAVFPGQLAFSTVEPGRKPLGSGPVAFNATTEMSLQRLYAGIGADVSVAAAVLPVFFGQRVQLVCQTDRPVDPGLLAQRWLAAGFEVSGLNDEGEASLMTSADENRTLSLADIRALSTARAGFRTWVTFDNVTAGVALNGVQTAELLIKDYL